MPFTPPDAATAAALSAVVGDVPDLEMCAGRGDDGQEWITVTWSGREVIMDRKADGSWWAFHPGDTRPNGTGMTPADALRESLASH